MSYINRYEREGRDMSRKDYNPNKNYDHDIFGAGSSGKNEVRHNNFQRKRQESTEISERRLDSKIRDISPFIEGKRNSHYVSNNIISHIPFQDNTYLRNNYLTKSHSQPHLDKEFKTLPEITEMEDNNIAKSSAVQKNKEEINYTREKPLKASTSAYLETREKVEKADKAEEEKSHPSTLKVVENPRVARHVNSSMAIEMEDRYLVPEKKRYFYHTKDNYNNNDENEVPQHFATQPYNEENKSPDNVTNNDGFAYVCINCLNRGCCQTKCDRLKAEREKLEDRKNPQTSNRALHTAMENLKVANRKKLIQDREAHTKEVEVPKQVLEKDNFADKQAEKEFTLNDNLKKDFYIERAKNRDKKIENFTKTQNSKFESLENKPKVTDYYKHLSDNSVPSEFHYALTDKNNQRKYNDYLKEQMIKKRIEEEKKKLDELNYALELKKQFDQKCQKEDKRKTSRLIKAKEDFLKQNNNFIEGKKAIDSSKKNEEKQADKDFIKSHTSLTEKLQRERDQQNRDNQRRMKEILEKQIDEKNNRRNLAKSQEHIVIPQRIYKFVENYESCFKCHRVFPSKALNLTNLKDARLQKKLSTQV